MIKSKSFGILGLLIILTILLNCNTFVFAQETEIYDASSLEDIEDLSLENIRGIIINESQFKNNQQYFINCYKQGVEVFIKDIEDNNIIGNKIISYNNIDFQLKPIVALTENECIVKNKINYQEILDNIINNPNNINPQESLYNLDYNFNCEKFIEIGFLVYANNKDYHVATVNLRYNFFEYINSNNLYYYFVKSNILVSPNTNTSRSFRIDGFDFDFCLSENSSAHILEEFDNSLAPSSTTSYGANFIFTATSTGMEPAFAINISCNNTSPVDSLSKNMSSITKPNGDNNFVGKNYSLTPNHPAYHKSFTWDYASSIVSNPNDEICISMSFNGLGVTGMGWDPNFEDTNTDSIMAIVGFNSGNLNGINGFLLEGNIVNGNSDEDDDYFYDFTDRTNISGLGGL